MKMPNITTGGKGKRTWQIPLYAEGLFLCFILTGLSTFNNLAERVGPAANILSKVFETDPVITYMLSTLSIEKRLAYLPSYFNSLLTAAALNNAIFDEAENWSSCAVWMLPGYRVDNPWTLLSSGLLGLCWNIGITGCSVSQAVYFSAISHGEAKQEYESRYGKGSLSLLLTSCSRRFLLGLF